MQKTLKAKAKASFLSLSMLMEINQGIGYNKQFAQNAKSSISNQTSNLCQFLDFSLSKNLKTKAPIQNLFFPDFGVEKLSKTQDLEDSFSYQNKSFAHSKKADKISSKKFQKKTKNKLFLIGSKFRNYNYQYQYNLQ